jgi:hypothetical protein
MIGLPPPSARRCSLVENPPWERPRASSGASPPDGAGPASAGGVLMSANNGGIDKVQVPVDLTTGIRLSLQSRQEALPETRLAPAIEPAGDGADRAIALRQIAPGRAGTQNPENAVQDGAVMVVGPPCWRPLGRQKRLKALPLPVRQLVTCHVG